MDLTYLDLGFYKQRGSSNDNIFQLVEIAPFIEELGYKRIWVGEHHSLDCSWRSPEIIISLLLASTETIKIGSSGNLLMLHNSLRLAQDYSLLEGLFNGRVDLGLAFGSTPDDVKNALTNNFNDNITLDTKVKELISYFDFEKNEKYSPSFLIPPFMKGVKPNIWALSTSNSKFNLAIDNKLNYVWSLFHKKEENWPNGKCVIDFQNKYFHTHGEIPETAISITGIFLEDKKRQKNLIDLFKGNFHITVSGSKEECKERIYTILKKYQGIKQVVISDLSLTLEDKKENLKTFYEIVKDINLPST